MTADMFEPVTKENPNPSLGYDIWGWSMIAQFFGGIISSIVTNKRWLLWKAHADDRKWYAKPEATRVQNFSAPSYSYESEPVPSVFADPTSPVPNVRQTPSVRSNQATPSTSVTEIDVNTATVQDLVSGLGIDTDTATRIVNTRSSLGSFTSFEQLMTRAQVMPHLLIPHRNKLTFGAVQSTPDSHTQHPEPKNNSNVRRLDI
ncbi:MULTISPECIES: ComEA family DNA-binding protein [Glutamicibacter]|uniref:ComEA family DNA-binding protein n=1 Tax=Glutamicibacter TaxID=1742989 RepID=UPI00257D875C|nr:helix-hairpin-helix domain-containing protein [Glutamicibacter sp.]